MRSRKRGRSSLYACDEFVAIEAPGVISVLMGSLERRGSRASAHAARLSCSSDSPPAATRNYGPRLRLRLRLWLGDLNL